MQEVKNHLKNMGKKLQGSSDAHKDALRKKLLALQPEETIVPSQRLAWFPVLSWGAIAVVVLVIGTEFSQRPVVAPEYESSNTAYYIEDHSLVADVSDSAGMVGDTGFVERAREEARTISIPYGNDGLGGLETMKDDDIIDYEQDNGAMLEQSVNIRILTREDDASETVAALFASLGGHLSSIRSNDDEYATITGSIPASRMSFFYEQIDALVKNDAFIEKTLRGDSVTTEALDLADREEALRAAEISATEQLQAATTEEEKKRLQESLETISEEMVQLAEEQDLLDDRVDYVTVSVNIEKLPSLFGVQSEHQLNDVIAGFERPTLWQGILINVLTVFFIVVEFLSITFWILIPLAIFVLIHLKRRRVLKELE